MLKINDHISDIHFYIIRLKHSSQIKQNSLNSHIALDTTLSFKDLGCQGSLPKEVYQKATVSLNTRKILAYMFLFKVPHYFRECFPRKILFFFFNFQEGYYNIIISGCRNCQDSTFVKMYNVCTMSKRMFVF